MDRNLGARANRGFTLVELVVVVTIIGLLAALAVVAYNSAVKNAQLTKSQALVNTLATAKTLFISDPLTTLQAIENYNSADAQGGGDAEFAFIAPYRHIPDRTAKPGFIQRPERNGNAAVRGEPG